MDRCVLLLAFIPFILFEIILGCEPPPEGEEPSLDQNIYYSDVVVYGNAKRQLPSEHLVEFEVLCSYKGGRLPQMINITRSDHALGGCFEMNLDPGMSYVLLLDRKGNGLFQPTSNELNGEIYLEEVLFICDLDPQFPSGITESTAKTECPAIESECISYTPVTDATTTKEESGKDVKYDHTKDTENDDDTKVEDVQPVESSDGKNGATVAGVSLAVVLICATVTSSLV